MTPGHEAVMRHDWDRSLWGVMFTDLRVDDAPMLLGEAWASCRMRARFEGEPSRTLLFTTRAAARHWCDTQHRAWKSGNEALRSWRVRPVRVRETVRIAWP